MSDSVQPHKWQPTRLPRPWDSPGKNTGVGCHFLLQCMKVKSESEVTQSCLTLSDPMDCSPPGSSIHGIFQARVLEWGTIAFSITIAGLLQKHSMLSLYIYIYIIQCHVSRKIVLLFQMYYITYQLGVLVAKINYSNAHLIALLGVPTW